MFFEGSVFCIIIRVLMILVGEGFGVFCYDDDLIYYCVLVFEYVEVIVDNFVIF